MENNIVKDIKEIIENSITTQEIGGKVFSSVNLRKIDTKDRVEGINFGDLSSIVSLIKAESARFLTPLYVNIENYNKVSVFSSLDINKERENPYSAIGERNVFNFGKWYQFEDFVISLRSQFVINEDLQTLLSDMRRFSNDNSVTLEDDGVTQKVTTNNGAHLAVGSTTAPIRVLKPYRTFSEIEQPQSEFLFRIRDNGFALFEADGGAWKLAAKANIRKYFEDALKEEIKNNVVIVVG